MTARGDWIVAPRHAVTATYKRNDEGNDRADAGVGYHTVPPVRDIVRSNFLSVGWTTSPGPRWTNEARAGFNLAPGEFRNSAGPENYRLGGLLFSNPTVNFQDQGRYTDTYNYRDNAEGHLGRHTLRLGFDVQQVRVESFDAFGVLPEMSLGIGAQSQFQMSGAPVPGRDRSGRTRVRPRPPVHAGRDRLERRADLQRPRPQLGLRRGPGATAGATASTRSRPTSRTACGWRPASR